MIDRLQETLGRQVDVASTVVFRVGFGLLATFAAVRFVALGWVDALLIAPSYHFVWIPGLEVPGTGVLHLLFAIQATTGLAIAWGWRPRIAIGAWLLSFGFVELLDKTLYLNHYVLFTLLGLWLFFRPPSHDALGRGETTPIWHLWLLRIQVASVYWWAGIAKLNEDWLLRAEPLATWLSARVDTPLVGPIFELDATAYVMSWGGAAYDLAIPFLLMHPKTRPIGFVLVVAFHLTVSWLFPIGIFGWLMILSATLFFDPSWPNPDDSPEESARPLGIVATGAWLLVVSVIILVPGRYLLTSQDVNWSEENYRFAWRVMLNEKTGFVEYRVVEPSTGREWIANPSADLSLLQRQHMRTSPELIRQYALHLSEQHREAGRDVAIYAESWVKMNQGPRQRLLRPDVDLTRSLRELRKAEWIIARKR